MPSTLPSPLPRAALSLDRHVFPAIRDAEGCEGCDRATRAGERVPPGHGGGLEGPTRYWDPLMQPAGAHSPPSGSKFWAQFSGFNLVVCLWHSFCSYARARVLHKDASFLAFLEPAGAFSGSRGPVWRFGFNRWVDLGDFAWHPWHP